MGLRNRPSKNAICLGSERAILRRMAAITPSRIATPARLRGTRPANKRRRDPPARSCQTSNLVPHSPATPIAAPAALAASRSGNGAIIHAVCAIGGGEPRSPTVVLVGKDPVDATGRQRRIGRRRRGRCTGGGCTGGHAGGRADDSAGRRRAAVTT